ncbi:hypothetical protein [uncultured Fusobacterium sp.]|uniref:hypothetical protein n=1 Tax=uncultured Fusobacterium sp. TaxID=159267 RepID=UPI0025E61657|nr:hypothetical protein [uncultured Fusobacterium sp.]
MKVLKILMLQIMVGTIALSFSGQPDWSTVAVYDNKIPENIVMNIQNIQKY